MTKKEARVERIVWISTQIQKIENRIIGVLEFQRVQNKKLADLGDRSDEDSNYMRIGLAAKIISFEADVLNPLLEQRRALTEEMRSVSAKIRFKGRKEAMEAFDI